MKCHQLPGGIWQSRYAGASRNIDSFICNLLPAFTKAVLLMTKRIISPHISFEKIGPGNSPESESGVLVFGVFGLLLR